MYRTSCGLAKHRNILGQEQSIFKCPAWRVRSRGMPSPSFSASYITQRKPICSFWSLSLICQSNFDILQRPAHYKLTDMWTGSCPPFLSWNPVQWVNFWKGTSKFSSSTYLKLAKCRRGISSKCSKSWKEPLQRTTLVSLPILLAVCSCTLFFPLHQLFHASKCSFFPFQKVITAS